ncbi:MAG: RNA polymerase factor sigma-54 [Chloroflexota bacterium]|nr:RNA polymerase factor sigma-54 [Chloroflexota bacterium]
MRLEPTPRPEQVLRVSARLITSSTILHLSADELERAVNQEQTENPALDVSEQRICLFCGTRIYGSTCTACGHVADHFTNPLPSDGEAPALYEPIGDAQWTQQGPYDMDNYGFVEIDGDDAYDPMARIPTNETLAETLLLQLEALISPDDAPIAEQLVGSLNERGYLEADIREIAEQLDVPHERIEYVLKQLQMLEPLGIGARDLRECLLIQLEALSEQSTPQPLVHTLIDHYLDQLGHNQFHEIARQLKRTEQEIRQASQYIRAMLHPFPALIYQHNSGGSISGTTYIRPDVIIRKGETGFEVELIEEKRYRFTVNTRYGDSAGAVALANREVQHYLHQNSDRAKFFVDCVQRRWRTLKRVAELVVDYQRGFLDKGIRYLRPLTRAEVASRLNLDEGTVSRATANKYALLPNGRLMPFSDFFDGSLSIKDVLRELIQSEDSRHRLSDDELARLLSSQGLPMARRTVTKYREEMGIGSSRER